MTLIRCAIARLRALFRRDATMDEIREELTFHLQMRTEEYARCGVDPRTARQTALRKFGNVAVIQDRGYDIRGGGVVETMLQDLKYGLRQMGQHRAFSVVAGSTLALAIGICTALFSIIDVALLRPLPYPHPEELVTIAVEEVRENSSSRYAPSMADVRSWRTLTTVIAHAGMGRVSGFVPLIVDAGGPERLTVAKRRMTFSRPMASRQFLAEAFNPRTPGKALHQSRCSVTRTGGVPSVPIPRYWVARYGSRINR